MFEYKKKKLHFIENPFLRQKRKATNHTMLNCFVEEYKSACIYKKHITQITQEAIIDNNSLRLVIF